jgi:hypothetical protein
MNLIDKARKAAVEAADHWWEINGVHDGMSDDAKAAGDAAVAVVLQDLRGVSTPAGQNRIDGLLAQIKEMA